MGAAQALGDNGWGRTFPNPLVGAVVVQGEQVVGTGWHREHGGLHAEVEALNAVGPRSLGGTLYVTLEPCRHHGKQPPCTDRIIAAGIARVVIGQRDPNPEARGGLEQLQAAGIAVDLAGLPRHDTNFRFHWRFTKATRPYVAVKLAASMDGMIADASGNSRWVSGEASRDWVHWLRAGFGAIAVGARTAVADGARLTVRGATQPRIAPTRIVFDRSAILSTSHVIFNSAGSVPLIIVVGVTSAPDRVAAYRAAGARVLAAATASDALVQLLEAGVDSILVEGGGRLAGSLLRDQLVDRIYQVQCPRWLGAGTPAWSGLGTPGIADSVRWSVVNTEPIGLGEDRDVLIEMENC